MSRRKILFRIVGAILAINLFCVIGWVIYCWEENWRANQAWEKVKAEIESRGETVDYNKLVPPPVPDDQNLGALPLFRLEPDQAEKGQLKPLALQRALENVTSDYYRLPASSRMFQGQMADLDAISKNISARYQKIFHTSSQTPEPSTLEELEALCPVMAEIRTAAKERPFCRFLQDYVTMPPYNRPMGLSPKLIAVAQVFTLHAVLALHANQPDVALDDMRTLFKIDSDLRKEPILVSGLVAVGVMAIQEQAIWEGINLHAWNEAQLAELQDSLKSIEFFSTFQNCIRGEGTGFVGAMMDYFIEHPITAPLLFGMSSDTTSENQFGQEVITHLMRLLPSGWYTLAKARTISLYYRAADECADSKLHRFYPEKSDQIAKEAAEPHGMTPAEILRRIATGPILNCCSTFAQAQFQIDAARLACMAERYRLVHGAYPESLDELFTLPGDIPPDVVNGEQLHYVLKPNGSFLLYSVGWNLKDDGGVRATQPGNPDRQNGLEGDWIRPALGGKN